MKDLQHMQFYLPGVVVKSIVDTEESADGVWRPAPRDLTTVCLFVDVSGFTSLTEQLCDFGPNGLEELSLNLNKFATQIVKQTTRSGGDVLKFAGDAIMALWPEVDPTDPNDYLLRVQRAVQCALDIQLRLDHFQFAVFAKDENYKDIEQLADGSDAALKRPTLRAKIGLGMGQLRLLHLGGRGDLTQRERFEYVALGPALMQAIASETLASPGEVVVSRDIWASVGSKFVPVKTLPDKCVVVKEWDAQQFAPWRSFDRSVRYDRKMERKLWKYVPNAVLPYLVFTQDDFWAPELRSVTTLFFDLGLDIPELTSGMHTEKLEAVFYEIQGSVLAYEGTVNKFLVDDKGATLICVFGLPPLAHEDDALRGVLTGLKVLASLSKRGLPGSVGIATGMAFCGIIGHATSNRREYSVIGDSVNLAARLMVSARERKLALLVDRATRNALPAGTVLSFAAATTEVKGKKRPVHCYQLSRAAEADRLGSSHDVHQWQQTRLQSLASTYNVSVWATGGAGAGRGANRQKTRRRPTRTNALNADQMRELEAQQHKAMNDTRQFLERKRQNALKLQQQQRTGGARAADQAPSGTAAFTAASMNAAMTDDLDREGVPSTPPSSKSGTTSKMLSGGRKKSSALVAAVVLFLPGEAELPAETRVNLASGGVASVLDVMEGAIEAFVAQGLIPATHAAPSWFNIFWLRDDDRVRLRPTRLLDSIPVAEAAANAQLAGSSPPASPHAGVRGARKGKPGRGSTTAAAAVMELRLQLVMLKAVAEPMPELNPTGPQYVRGRIAALQDEVFNGNGGRVVLLDGDYGVGKTELVESYYLSKEMSELEDDMFFGYARGNRFETGRNARQFSVVADLMAALLLSVDGDATADAAAATPAAVVAAAAAAAATAPVLKSEGSSSKKKGTRAAKGKAPKGKAAIAAAAAAAAAAATPAAPESPAAAPAKPRTQRLAGNGAQTRDEVVAEALKAARRAYALEDLQDEDRYLLNPVLGTVFPGGPDDSDDDVGSADEVHPFGTGAQKQTKKANRFARARNVQGANGRVNRVKQLGVLWGTTSVESALSDGGGAPGGSAGGAAAAAAQSRRPSGLLKRLSRRPSKPARAGGAQQLHPQASHEALVADKETQLAIRLLAGVLGGLATRAPVTVIVDDSQDMDPFSWLVFLELAERWMRANILVILLHRPERITRKLLSEQDAEGEVNSRFSMFKPAPARMRSQLRLELLGREAKEGDLESSTALHRSLLALPAVEPLELHARPGDTRDILLGYAGVSDAPDSLVRFIQRKTRGNPKFVCDSLDEFLGANLVARGARDADGEQVLLFPDEEFEALRVARALPVPVSVTAVAGAMLDRMDLTQQIITKVASILGEVFTRGDIRAIFPVDELRKNLDERFQELVEAGFFVLERPDQALGGDGKAGAGIVDNARYTFEYGWLDDVLRARMLNTQKVKLQTAKRRLLAVKEEQQKAAYMAQAKGKLDLRHEGIVQVRKGNARNIMKPWKPRFCRLHNGELVQFYDRDNPKRLEVIILTGESSVAFDALGHVAPEAGRGGGGGPAPVTLHCFRISTDRWEKQGKLRTERRDFTLGVETDDECKDWVFKVQYVIDMLRLPAAAQPASQSGAGLALGAGGKGGSGKSAGLARGGNDSGVHRGSESAAVSDEDDDEEDDDDGEDDGHAAGSARGVVELRIDPDAASDSEPAVVAPDPGAGKGPQKKLKGIFRHGKKRGSAAEAAGSSAGAAAAGAAGVSYGARTGPLTPEVFAAVSQAATLAVFWTQTNAPKSAPAPRVPAHTSELFYECAEMSLVSRNSLGQIDGYLLGKLKAFRNKQHLGLVTACAVLPWARRQGIARRLFHKFFAMCRAKGCRYVRSNVDSDSSIAIAFHRSLGFDQDDEQTEWLARAGDEGKMSFLKDLNLSSAAEEDAR